MSDCAPLPLSPLCWTIYMLDWWWLAIWWLIHHAANEISGSVHESSCFWDSDNRPVQSFRTRLVFTNEPRAANKKGKLDSAMLKSHRYDIYNMYISLKSCIFCFSLRKIDTRVRWTAFTQTQTELSCWSSVQSESFLDWWHHKLLCNVWFRCVSIINEQRNKQLLEIGLKIIHALFYCRW